MFPFLFGSRPYVPPPPAACVLPWGGTVDSGGSVTAYKDAAVPYGTTPESESRVCDNGVLSGSFTHQSCVVAQPTSCTLPWGGTVASGASVTAYQTSSVPYGTSPVSEQRTCTNGVLSGSYTFSSCTVGQPVACALPWGGTTANGTSVTAYKDATVPYGTAPVSEQRTCANGVLSGTYVNPSCTVLPQPVLGSGYAMGGYNAGAWKTIDGLRFDTEAAVHPSATLDIAHGYTQGVNSSDCGYAMGGYSSSSGSTSATVSGFKFVDESSKSVQATLSVPRSNLASFNSTARGYVTSGASSTSLSLLIDGIEFASETTISVSSQSVNASNKPNGVGSDQKGFTLGGYSSTDISTNPLNSNGYTRSINSFSYSSETAAMSSASLSLGRFGVSGVNSVSRGYALSGSVATSTYYEIDGLEFASESSINPSAALSHKQEGGAGVNSSIKGYALGGYTGYGGTAMAEIDGILFSTETAINPVASLSSSRMYAAGVQSGGYL